MHTFVICAYKESPYLGECISSLLKQTVKSRILIVTSTPNEYITRTAAEYELPVIVNKGQGGIVQDWNFAYKQADTPYVTIAHQDDVYFPDYTEQMLRQMRKEKRPLIWFSDYAEIRNGQIVKNNKLLHIKRMMLLPLRIKGFWKSRFIRRRVLSFGCPICCPSVGFAKANLPETVFQVGFRSAEDWQAWESLSRLKGSFIYNKTTLVGHRIHEDSETSHILQDDQRKQEDYTMFCKFWPKWIARLLTRAYSESEKSNEL